jgi:hypothetical protein
MGETPHADSLSVEGALQFSREDSLTADEDPVLQLAEFFGR